MKNKEKNMNTCTVDTHYLGLHGEMKIVQLKQSLLVVFGGVQTFANQMLLHFHSHESYLCQELAKLPRLV